MSNETNHAPVQYNPNLLTGLALVGGIGITAIMIALGVGVIQGEAADSTSIGLLILAGFVALAFAIGGWLIYVQPHTHFDDINQPLVEDHHGEEHATAH